MIADPTQTLLLYFIMPVWFIAGFADYLCHRATDAVPETLESSLQLSEAVLVDLGIAMGPVIASIHEKRAELRQEIMQLGEAAKEPPLRRRTLRDALRR